MKYYFHVQFYYVTKEYYFQISHLWRPLLVYFQSFKHQSKFYQINVKIIHLSSNAGI